MTQKEISDVFSDASTEIGGIVVPKKGWFSKIFRRKATVTLSVGIIPAGKVQKIGVLLKNMTDYDSIVKLSQAEQINTLLSENIDPIIEIIALAVAGNKENASKEVQSAIGNQWGMQQIHFAFNEVYRRLDLPTFFDILNLSKNISLNLFPDKEPHGQV